MIKSVFSNAQDKVIVHNIKTKLNQIARIQEQIGLTQAEVLIILYTSLDQDYFNNLLISEGQFTEWFNINFEGETQEEIDFKENQEGEWVAICDQAKMLIDKYQKLTDTGAKMVNEILTQTWWNHARFDRVGNGIKASFDANPAVRQKVIANFKDHKNKLSYFDFFNHVEFDIKLQLKDWECDALENRLDRLGLAYIDYWEFVEFMEDFGV